LNEYKESCYGSQQRTDYFDPTCYFKVPPLSNSTLSNYLQKFKDENKKRVDENTSLNLSSEVLQIPEQVQNKIHKTGKNEDKELDIKDKEVKDEDKNDISNTTSDITSKMNETQPVKKEKNNLSTEIISEKEKFEISKLDEQMEASKKEYEFGFTEEKTEKTEEANTKPKPSSESKRTINLHKSTPNEKKKNQEKAEKELNKDLMLDLNLNSDMSTTLAQNKKKTNKKSPRIIKLKKGKHKLLRDRIEYTLSTRKGPEPTEQQKECIEEEERRREMYRPIEAEPSFEKDNSLKKLLMLCQEREKERERNRYYSTHRRKNPIPNDFVPAQLLLKTNSHRQQHNLH
jgi:hypothetical protein